MRKKALILLLLFILGIMLALVGCSGSDDQLAKDTAAPSDTDSPSEAVDSTDSSDGKTVALSLSGPGNTSANLMHNGIAAEYDGYVYYVDKMMEGSLWKVPVGGGDNQLLLEGSFHDINVSGGVIFAVGYMASPDDASLNIYGIFMMNTDGSGLATVKEGYFEELILFDEYLYFADYVNGGLYRMKYDGSDEKLLLEDIYSDFSIVDGYLYILASDENSLTNIYKMSLDGSSPPEVVVADTFGGSMDIALGGIFYSSRDNSSNTYRYDTATGEVSVFSPYWLDDVNTDGQYIYYYWSGVRQDDLDAGIYRANPDGSEALLLMQTDYYFDLNIAGGKMYWHNNDAQRRLTVMNLDGSDIQFVEMVPE